MIRRWWQKHSRKFCAAACDNFTDPFFLLFLFLYFFFLVIFFFFPVLVQFYGIATKRRAGLALPVSTTPSPPRSIYLWITLQELRRDSSCVFAVIRSGGQRPAGLKLVGFGAGAASTHLHSLLHHLNSCRAGRCGCSQSSCGPGLLSSSWWHPRFEKYLTTSFTHNFITALKPKHTLKCFPEMVLGLIAFYTGGQS